MMTEINFKPFIGEKYRMGINGKRVLSLGESHYAENAKDARHTIRDWWERIAMYNFVQVPMLGPRESPSSQDFRDSDDAFFTILEQLKPDCVIAWGKRLYNNLPRTGRQGPDCGDEETWIYETSDGHEVRVLPIIHPSAAFDTAYWQKEIYTFLH